MVSGFDDQTLIRYRFKEYNEALDREGHRCWMCGKPLTTCASGRAHRIANNKQNKKKYGSWVLDHKLNFFMSCNTCNSYATKYKPDPEGEYQFDVIIGHNENQKPIKCKSIKMSRLTEQDKLDIIEEIEADLLERGIDKKKPDKPIRDSAGRSRAGLECHRRVTSLRRTLDKKNVTADELEAKYIAYKRASDVLLADLGKSNRKYTSLRTRKKYDKLYQEKIRELLSETTN